MLCQVARGIGTRYTLHDELVFQSLSPFAHDTRRDTPRSLRTSIRGEVTAAVYYNIKLL